MTLRVIVPPQPIVAPGDIPGSHAADDQRVAAMIAAATAEIDGPDGWVGRAFGAQTLELSGWFGCKRIALPCRPIIEIESIVTEDYDGDSLTIDPDDYRLDGDELVIASRASWTGRPTHRVRYQARML